MGQLGTMIFFLLPVAVGAGRTSLLAIPMAGILSCLLAAFTEDRQSIVYNVIRKILAVGFGLLVWYRLSLLWAGYLGWNRYWPVAGLVLLGMLLLGRGNCGFRLPGTACRAGTGDTAGSPKNDSCDVPGREGLKGLWSKVIGLFLALLLLFQIPNMDLGYTFSFSHGDAAGFWKETLILLLADIPFWLELGKNTAGGQGTLWKKQLGLWGMFFLVFVVLAAVFRFPLLVQSDTVFLNLGRSAVWFGKAPVRMEIPADVVLWVTVFFALWECVDTLFESLHPADRKKGKGRSEQEVL